MESAVRTICEPIFGRPLREISFGTVLLRLFAALQRFDGHIQPQLILLQKTLLNVEGLGRQLYPDLDIWKTASPVLRAWRRDRMHPRTVLRELRRGLPDVFEIMKALPTLAKEAIERSEDNARQAEYAATAAAAPIAAPADNVRRDLLIASAALIPGGVLWLGLQVNPQWPGVLLAVAGVLVMAAAMFRA